MTMPAAVASDSIPHREVATAENAWVTVDDTATESERLQEYLDLRMAASTREKYKREGPKAFVSNQEVKQAQQRRRAI